MRILLVVIFSLLNMQVFGQQTGNKELSFYAGIWEYHDTLTDERLMIVFEQRVEEVPSLGSLDCLYGAYKHSKGSVTVTDCLASVRDNHVNLENVPIFGYRSPNQRDMSYVKLWIFDYKHGNRLRNCRLHFVSAEPPRIQLELVENDELYAGETLGLPGFSLPNFVTLTKKE